MDYSELIESMQLIVNLFQVPNKTNYGEKTTLKFDDLCQNWNRRVINLQWLKKIKINNFD